MKVYDILIFTRDLSKMIFIPDVPRGGGVQGGRALLEQPDDLAG
jgi:hypothetical protein